jgi:putative transposase
MPRKAHTEEQIVAVLRQGKAGEKVADICRKVGISEGTYYAWKEQYAGLGSMSCASCGSCGTRTGV